MEIQDIPGLYNISSSKHLAVSKKNAIFAASITKSRTLNHSAIIDKNLKNNGVNRSAPPIFYDTIEDSSKAERNPYLDSPEDFTDLETVSGTFTRFHTNRKNRHYALVDLDDGRRTRVWRHYFRRFGPFTEQLQPGDRLTLRKIGYAVKPRHTSWEVTALPVRIMMNLPAEKKERMTERPLHRFRWQDSDDDFEFGVEEDARICRILSVSNPRSVLVEFSDGAATMVTRGAFLRSGLDIKAYHVGDTIRLRKTGYNAADRITRWRVMGNCHKCQTPCE